VSLISWCYMLATWAAIIGLNVFCFYRIFSKRNGGNGSAESKE